MQNKMIQLKEMIDDLKNGLKHNGALHINYKRYMTIDRALDLLKDGYLYLSDGSGWNDKVDRAAMKLESKKTFAACFSWARAENVAMWMLYGGERGAMLNFTTQVRNDILASETVELGYSDDNHIFQLLRQLDVTEKAVPAQREAELFFADIVYKEETGNQKVKLTVGDEHCTVPKKALADVLFSKHYAWAYEKECRLIVRILKDDILSPSLLAEVPTGRPVLVRVRLSERSIAILKEQLYTSPIFKGKVSCDTSVKPQHSELHGLVDWDLKGLYCSEENN